MTTTTHVLRDQDALELQVAGHLGWAPDLSTADSDRIREEASWICHDVQDTKEPRTLPDGWTLSCSSSLRLSKQEPADHPQARSAKLADLHELREEIRNLAEERETVLMLTVSEIIRRESQSETIRTLLPEADIARATFYARRGTAARVQVGVESLVDLKARRIHLDEQLEQAKAARNEILAAAGKEDVSAFARAANVTTTWVRLLKRAS